jgi:glycosyltransferase involved in cell wall biosynthesis
MSVYRAEDIDVIVLSYNRGCYLLETIQCLMDQSLRDIRITVLDNASGGETAEILRTIEDRGVRVIVNEENIGGVNNLKKAQHLASKQWTIIFHDDDLIHTKYIENVLKVLNQNDGITMVAALTELTDSPDTNRWKADISEKALIFQNAGQFAQALFKGLPVPFCSLVYKTELLKETQVEEIYGKVADRPFAFDCIGDGKVAVLNDIYIQSRTHQSQDSNDYASGPFADKWIALVKKYRSLMGDSILTSSGRTFLNRGTRTLLMTMNPYIYKDIGKKRYVELAIKTRAISKTGYYLGLPYYYLYKAAKAILK